MPITCPNEYRNVYKNGKLLKGQSIWIYLLPTKTGQIRSGVSVSRKVSKKATTRNRLRRIIKEWLRQNLTRCGTKSYDIVIVLKKAVSTSSSSSRLIRRQLADILKIK